MNASTTSAAPGSIPARGGAREHAASVANAVLRKAILVAADSPSIQRFVSRYGMRLGGARFVAGETLDQAVGVLRGLNQQGLRTNTTLLGESVTSREEVLTVVEGYEQLLDRIAAEQLQTNVALKLTHLGLELDPELAYVSLERLVRRAAEHGNFIRIDMEDSRQVEPTLAIYRRLRAAGHDNVGCVLQAYLYRSESDLEALLALRPNVRIVKGAYLEPASIAYPDKQDVDAAYARLVERSLPAAGFTAVATHDERLIELALAVARREGLDSDRFELQMLYGVRPALQLELVSRGLRVLVATPYGPEWYPYLMRRLAERPANILFFLRNLVRG
jgi:proline dehydrogenase